MKYKLKYQYAIKFHNFAWILFVDSHVIFRRIVFIITVSYEQSKSVQIAKPRNIKIHHLSNPAKWTEYIRKVY